MHVSNHAHTGSQTLFDTPPLTTGTSILALARETVSPVSAGVASLSVAARFPIKGAVPM